MKTRSFAMIVGLGAFLAAAFVPPAAAEQVEELRPADPAVEESVTEVEPSDSEVMERAREDGRIDLDHATAEVSCKRHWARSYLYAVYSYGQEVEWCYDGSQIIGTPVVIRSVATPFPGVSFEGHTDRTRSWINNPISYRSYTQGHFTLGAYNHYPAVDIRVYGSGNSSASVFP